MKIMTRFIYRNETYKLSSKQKLDCNYYKFANFIYYLKLPSDRNIKSEKTYNKNSRKIY